MTERRRVAVVGLGIGLAHVVTFKQLRERYEIVAVCDPDTARAEETVAGLRGVEVVGFDDLVARDDVEIISICTPPHLHLAQCRAVVESGKHVICEKPLVGSLRDVDELVRLEADTGRWIMPVYQYRYGAGVQRVAHLLAAGVSGPGRTAAAEVSWRRRADYYAGWRGRWATELGGALVSHALHSLDLITMLLGPAERVFARLATLTNDVETEDTVALALEHEGGALSTLSATLGSTPEVSRLRLTYERLTAESNHEPYEFPGEPWTVTGDTDEDQAAIGAALEGFEPVPEGWAGQFEAFDRTLAEGAPPPVTLADARAGLEVVTAGYRSARTGADVALPLSPDDEDYGGWWL